MSLIFSHKKRGIDLSKIFVEIGDSLICKEKIRVVFPKRFVEGKLGSVTSKYEVIGFFAIMAGDTFAVCKYVSMFTFSPDSSTELMINGEKYMELTLERGSAFLENLNLVSDDELVFHVFNEFISKGKAPVYMNYLDQCHCLDTASVAAGANLPMGPAIATLFTATRARTLDDKAVEQRTTFKKQEDLYEDMFYIGLKSVSYGATNTTASLMGAYGMTEGINSSLNSPTKRTQQVERLIRA